MHVVLCSSRSPKGIGLVQHQLGTVGDLMVAYQGGMVTTWDGCRLTVERQATVSTDAVAQIEHQALALGLSVSAYAELDWCCVRVDRAIERAAAITREQPRTVSSLTEGSSAHKVLVIADEPDQLAALAVLEAELPATVKASRSHVNYLEITAAHTDKGTGLLTACEVLDIQPCDTVAVGDGFNDLPMLAAAGHAIVMGQAPPLVRAAADHVIGDNTTDDLAAHLRQLASLSNLSVRSTT
ncbi:Cof-type HAD-IIB family hydrolase [Nocardioides sp. AN3]